MSKKVLVLKKEGNNIPQKTPIINAKNKSINKKNKSTHKPFTIGLAEGGRSFFPAYELEE